MPVEVAAAAAVVGAIGGTKAVFDYNRENFLYDRKMRMKKELWERAFRIAQANLWREDVRDIVGLAERKMKAYLLVNVLMLGFCVSLWCMGRLKSGTPEWVMLGAQIAIGGSFIYLLLTVWFAVHAAIVAQSYRARVLTQLVRLPIPSWEELEACRTYGSEYEKLQARQQFRVPFLTGLQEDRVDPQPVAENTGASSSTDRASSSTDRPPPAGVTTTVGGGATATQAIPVNNDAFQATDPWGLERAGLDIPELGTKYGKDVSKLRHTQIMYEASKHWQTHDAYARVCMSIGGNQLIVALSYYVIGYVLIEVQCSWGALCCILLMSAISEAIALLDMMVTVWQHRIIQALSVIGPVTAWAAAQCWGSVDDTLSQHVDLWVAPFAFISHGTFLAVLFKFCAVTEMPDGSMLPTAFRSVLYLDVFGQYRDSVQKPGKPIGEVTKIQLAPPKEKSLFDHNVRMSARKPMQSLGTAGFYASDYIQEEESEEETRVRTAPSHASPLTNQPALRSAYTASTAPQPTRPDDLAPEGAVQDMRAELEVGSNAKLFFSPASFMLTKVEKEGESEDGDVWIDEESLEMEKEPHQKMIPKMSPWLVFRATMLLIIVAWFGSAAYTFLQAAGIVDLHIPFSWEASTSSSTELTVSGVGSPTSVSFAVGAKSKQVRVAWPYSNIVPTAFACDSSGRHFAVTDGISLYIAHINPVTEQSYEALRMSIPQEETGSKSLLEFSQAPVCQSLLGEVVQDSSIVCGNNCELMVLHNKGTQVTACPLTHDEGWNNFSATISQSWLHKSRKLRHAQKAADEQVSGILIDHACLNRSSTVSSVTRHGCALVSTTLGRVLRLRPDKVTNELVPRDEFIVRSGNPAVAPTGFTTARAIGGGHLGVLQKNTQQIHLIDIGNRQASQSSFMMKASNPVAHFCVGGGELFMLSSTLFPVLWRQPLPMSFIQSGTALD